MAAISENKKNGKTVSYRFVVSLGRDAQKKQIRRIMTWTPPADMTPSKARKAAERAADAWELEIRAEHEAEEAAKAQGIAYAIPAEKRQDDFVSFINDTWLPLQVRGGNDKPTTVAFYQHMSKTITSYFKGAILQQITPTDIQKYLVYLRTEYRSKLGKPLSPKSIRHQYGTLNLIFGYAEQLEMLGKNPMHRVDAPKKQKHPVDALTQEQATAFFKLIQNYPLDFQCILHLLITTGIRRGECMGLKWSDIDEEANTITIERNVTYTPQSGVIVSTPKTTNSIRTIPVMSSTLALLRQYKQQTQQDHPRSIHDLKIVWQNTSDKSVRKIVFSVSCYYNGEESTKKYSAEAVIDPGQIGGQDTLWDELFPSEGVYGEHIENVSITYTDGSSVSIPPVSIEYVMKDYEGNADDLSS